jgi:tetratricopeptide (TPR) repeat protein
VNRSFFAGAGVGLGVGLVAALFAYQIGRAGGVLRPAAPLVAAPTAAPAPSGPTAPGPSGAPQTADALTPELAQRISVARRLVEADASSRVGWVELGNAYFDSHQPQAAVDAYARALQLSPGDPDVITDQGVMYLELGQAQRALENFQTAFRLAPAHVKSLFNQGVVYAYHLHDPARAEQVWNQLIQLAPASEDAARARAALAELQGRKEATAPRR